LPQTKILIYRARKSLKRELEKEGFKYEWWRIFKRNLEKILLL
jgi:hypothetical protein